MALWDKLQEQNKASLQSSCEEKVVEFPKSSQKPQSKPEASPIHKAVLQGKQARETRLEKLSPRNRPITKREALKVTDTPASYRPPPLETIHIKGFRFGQIANIKKIFREAGVHDGEARDFDFVGNDILEAIVIKSAVEDIIAKINTLCQKFPERFKHFECTSNRLRLLRWFKH